MGAPKGNKNAFKHGLYARHIPSSEQDLLRNMPPEDYQQEITMLRMVVKNIFEIHTRLHAQMQRQPEDIQSCDAEAFSKVNNSLSLAVTALSTLARTHALLCGADASLTDSFEQALASLPIFFDNKYLVESHSAAEDLQEVLVE
jgi:hypothetical protein